MIVLALLASILAFVAVLHFANATRAVKEAIATANDTAKVMGAAELGDDEKERRVRRGALSLFRSFLLIVLIAVAALASAAAIVWLGTAIGLYPFGEAIRVAAGWPFILTSSIGMVVVWVLIQNRRPHHTRNLDA